MQLQNTWMSGRSWTGTINDNSEYKNRELLILSSYDNQELSSYLLTCIFLKLTYLNKARKLEIFQQYYYKGKNNLREMLNLTLFFFFWREKMKPREINLPQVTQLVNSSLPIFASYLLIQSANLPGCVQIKSKMKSLLSRYLLSRKYRKSRVHGLGAQKSLWGGQGEWIEKGQRNGDVYMMLEACVVSTMAREERVLLTQRVHIQRQPKWENMVDRNWKVIWMTWETGWMRSRVLRWGVQESACEDIGDSFQKYKDCDMMRFAL